MPITGNLRTLSTVEIKPEVGGRLLAVYFREGDFVRKDQLLAEIDPVNYRLSYDQAAAALRVAEAGLERAQVSAEHAKTEKERADNLLRSGGITEKDHQAALTGIKEAETSGSSGRSAMRAGAGRPGHRGEGLEGLQDLCPGRRTCSEKIF